MVVAVFLLVIASCFFLYWSNERGRSAWQKYKSELEARGEILDWRACLPPPPPPDEENFAATPLLAAVAVRGRTDATIEAKFNALAIQSVLGGGGDHTKGERMDFLEIQSRLRAQAGAAHSFPPLPRDPAEDVLTALEPVAAELEELRKAATRPHAQIKLNFPDPISAEMPNFVMLRELAQMFELKAQAELRLGRAADAFADVRVICRLGDAGGSAPNLVSAMIQCAIYGLVVEPFWEGWVTDRWSDEQLAGFQELLSKTDLLAGYDAALRGERGHFNHILSSVPPQQLKQGFLASGLDDWRSLPAHFDLLRGNYAERNQLAYTRILDAYVLTNHSVSQQRVFVRRWDTNAARLEREIRRASMVTPLAAMGIPNFIKAVQSVVRNQTFLNLAVVVCALERYRRANGEYPESLDALIPVFAKSLPHDLITGGSLKYRRTANGKFLLYSVGWNETDDGGVLNKDREKGDWLWATEVKK